MTYKYPFKNLSFLIIKNDVVSKRLEYDLVNFISQYNFNLLQFSRTEMTAAQADVMYQHIAQKSFYPEVKKFMCQEIICTLWQHQGDAIKEMMKLTGVTNPQEASIGTVRNIWGTSVSHNAVHRSDSVESMKAELEIFNTVITIP